ncbi:MAG: hypothetical protein IJA55_05165 [Clostridia bacterium]|nr:hypothetical protein [Clostridia bacterium]
MKTKELLKEHFYKYPKAEIQDIFKFIHQSSFGCEHMVESLEKAVEYIKNEYQKGVVDADIEPLDGEYSRVPLSFLDRGLSAETLGKLFYLSAEKADGREVLLAKLDILRELIDDPELEKAVNDWAKNDFRALHHSERFRAEYKPSYRVISNRFIPFLPLFCELDKKLAEGKVILTVEGGSASGKSTLGSMLEDIYDCNVIHMDDFFLQMHQRTPERFKEVGGNLDRERFYDEVVTHLKDGREFCYRKFDCSTMSLGESVTVTPKNLTVIEGAYSMHPYFGEYYDLSVFLDIAPELQRARILKRNPQMADRFFNEWIPLERVYFSELDIPKKCDIIIDIN